MTNIKEAFTSFGVDEQTAEKAANRLQSGQAKVLVVSGKMLAGKDTLAPLVMEKLGHPSSLHQFFAEPLKREVTHAINIIKETISDEKLHPSKIKSTAANRVALESEIPFEQAQYIVNVLFEDVASGAVDSSYVRTKSTRMALQFWGTQIRRSQNENYWVEKVIQNVAQTLGGDAPVSSYVTDARFPNELEAVKSIGGALVRLNISPELQNARHIERDGIPLSDETRYHASETALDDYTGFDVSLSVDAYQGQQDEAAQYIADTLRKVVTK